MSKHTKETWDCYLESFAMKLTLREAAQRCAISLTTAFYWRHKILDALAADHHDQVLTGVIQADETYVQDNYKGNCQAVKNLLVSREVRNLVQFDHEKHSYSGYFL